MESKLKTILFGKPEQIEARREDLKDNAGNLITFATRSIFEPGYALRLAALMETKKEMQELLSLGAANLIIDSAIVYKIATQLGEYLGR